MDGGADTATLDHNANKIEVTDFSNAAKLSKKAAKKRERAAAAALEPKQQCMTKDEIIINKAEHVGWQQHTKGIGGKLLLLMGYKPGQGLGKNLQGMTEPLHIKPRIGRAAIGAKLVG